MKGPSIGSNITILVIDDNQEMNLLTAMVLRGAGYEVLQAHTGAEGIEKVHAHHPDIVLLNVILPDISGVDACRQIKEDQRLKDIIVILTSDDLTSSEYRAKELNMEADGFIVKPISNEQLLARIESTLRIKKTDEALKASETRYRRLFETAQDGVLILDADTGQIDDVNPFLKALLGYTHEEFMGKKLWEMVAFKNTEKSKAAFEELQRKGYIRYEDLPLRTKDGREIAVEFVSNVYQVNHHNVIQCNIRDITYRKLVEEELRKAHEEMERRVKERTAELSEACTKLGAEMVEREKAEDRLRQSYKMEAIGTLAGGIAHDFNNILSAIMGFTEMAIEDLPKGNVEEKHLHYVLQSAHRGKDLVKKILAFSRKTEHIRGSMSLTSIVKETIELLKASIPRTVEIVFRTTASSDTILASPGEIQQILMNLATNAAFAMEDEVGTLEISLSDVDFTPESPLLGPDILPGEYVQLVVSDTGVGMAPEVMKRIFEPFFTTREVGKGTGMGLPAVYGIVKDLQGTITVESRLEEGSTFRVFLPKTKVDVNSEQIKPEGSPRGNERVLFVDDDQFLAELGRDRLQRLGYTVTALTDANEAVATFSRDPFQFDLVITDQSMPKLTGLNLAKKLFKIRSDIPIILCTGHSDSISPEKVNEARIREFLMKPLAKEELASVVRRVLDTKSKVK